MIDSRFFDSLGPLDLATLADRAGARLADPSVAGRPIELVAPLSKAGAGAVSFLVDARRIEELRASGAGACFLSPALAEHAREGCAALVSDRPHLAWVMAANALHAIRGEDDGQKISVHPTARLEAGVVIAPGAVIGPNVSIGAGTRIGAWRQRPA